MERNNGRNMRLFWIIVPAVVALDVLTKFLAQQNLPLRVPQPILEQEWLRLTLVYNRGAAFGIHLGHDAVTRVAFILFTFIALVVLWKLLREAHDGDWLRVTAISAVTAGALGNLIDRVRGAQGVVDFIDVGIGVSRWPTFNVADMAVSTGAIALAIVLWRDESRPAPEIAATQTGTSVAEGSGESAA